jgi:Ca-activated chloride channel family protein
MLPILFGLALAGASAPAIADEGNTLLVIDGSGSMWGRFETLEEKRAKIDVVRELVRPIIAGHTSARIGLQSFGHRRKGDCSDVEIIAPPALERPNLLAALDKLNPRGKGPLAESLRQAAQGVGAERPASVIIIGDGIDNCRQDACAAAAEFAKAAPGVPVHVIGLGVAPAEHPALQCIPAATGGKFYDARDPVALAAAISEVTALALGDSPATVAAPTSEDAAAAKAGDTAAAAPPPSGVLATLALAQGAKPLDMPVTWRISKSGSNDVIKTVTAPALSENLAPGTYTIAAELNGLSARGAVEIEDGRSETLALSLDAGRLKVTAPVHKGEQPLIVVRQLPDQRASPASSQIAGETTASAAETVLMSRTASVDTALPPATYAVSMIAGDYRQDQTVTIAQGEEAAAAFQTGLGTLSLTAVLSEGGPAVTGATFSILEDDPDSPGGRRETRRSRASDPRFTLPPGTYYVDVIAGFAETRERVALSAGDAVTKTLVLPAAPVKLSATIAGAPARADNAPILQIERIEGASLEIARVTSGVYEGLLGAGQYRLTALLDQHGASASTEITVEAGKPLAHVLNIDAGEVALRSLADVTGGVFWEVKDASGKAVWHATAAEPRVLLAPGRYSVRLDSKDSELEVAFSIQNGESKTVELGAR